MTLDEAIKSLMALQAKLAAYGHAHGPALLRRRDHRAQGHGGEPRPDHEYFERGALQAHDR